MESSSVVGNQGVLLSKVVYVGLECSTTKRCRASTYKQSDVAVAQVTSMSVRASSLTFSFLLTRAAKHAPLPCKFP
jgi:hypothetical protein